MRSSCSCTTVQRSPTTARSRAIRVVAASPFIASDLTPGARLPARLARGAGMDQHGSLSGGLHMMEAPYGPGLRNPLRTPRDRPARGEPSRTRRRRPARARGGLRRPADRRHASCSCTSLGPSLIALGISIGSGEWLLGPQAVGQYGFVGVGWVILISAVLQTFYNVEMLPVRDGHRRGAGRRLGPGAARLPALGAAVGLPRHLRVHRRRLGRLGRAGRLRAGARRGRARRRRGAPAVGDRAAGAGLPHHRGGAAGSAGRSSWPTG